jgi:hypothetical protein
MIVSKSKKYFGKKFMTMFLFLFLLFYSVTPVFSQEILAIFGVGGEFLNHEYPTGEDMLNTTTMGVNVLFVGKSGFTVAAGTDLKFKINVGYCVDPIFGLGYIYYKTFYVGGVLNVIPPSSLGVADVCITPTFVGGYDFGHFLLGGQLSYMVGLGQIIGYIPLSGFRFSLGIGINVGNAVKK